MTRTRVGALTGLVALAAASPAVAHGIGGRGDLPIPKSFFVWAATLAVVLSFLVAAVMWSRARLPRAAIGGVALGRWTTTLRLAVSPLLRTAALVVGIVTVVAGMAGTQESSENLAPIMVYVVFWVGVLWASALFGDVWRMLNPWDTLAMLGSGRVGTAPPPAPDDRLAFSHWPAAAGLLAFQWLELAYVSPDTPRTVAIAAIVYTVVVLAAAARYGRRWIQTGEGFTVLFGLAAAISPIGRDADGALRLRVPFSGLATVAPRRGTAAVVLAVLGGTTFDGVSRTGWYGEQVRLLAGWDRTAYNTAALLAVIGLVSAAYLVATRLVAHVGRIDPRAAIRRFAPSLVPIAVAYSVAHYFSLFVFEGQGAWRLMSDPLGRGWDLFGTADHRIDFLLLSTTAIALVQTIAIVVGHAAAVILAHDRALEDVGQRRATASQVPMLVIMVGFTVTGLTLLLSA